MSTVPTITLKHKHSRRVENGHAWVFNNEIHEKPEDLNAGDLVRVVSGKGRYLGFGFFNPQSLMAVRLLSKQEPEHPEDIIRNHLKEALQRREFHLPDYELRRLVFSDSDFLPGLIIDQFGKGISIQIHIEGMERFRDVIVDTLVSELHPSAIYLRNDTHLREMEGLESSKEQVYGESATDFEVNEHGICYHVDPLGGQKTGFYIDQRHHRKAFRDFIRPGMSVLDAFCNEGGFALNAAAEGAEVLALDISQAALDRAEKNQALNSLAGSVTWEKADLMKWISKSRPEKFDVINLDPPSFARHRKNVPQARNAFRKLHLFGLNHLNPGGIMMTSACSHHLREDTLLETIQDAARKAGKVVNLVYRGYQPADHPIRIGMPETEYLKCIAVQVVG